MEFALPGLPCFGCYILFRQLFGHELQHLTVDKCQGAYDQREVFTRLADVVVPIYLQTSEHVHQYACIELVYLATGFAGVWHEVGPAELALLWLLHLVPAPCLYTCIPVNLNTYTCTHL